MGFIESETEFKRSYVCLPDMPIDKALWNHIWEERHTYVDNRNMYWKLKRRQPRDIHDFENSGRGKLTKEQTIDSYHEWQSLEGAPGGPEFMEEIKRGSVTRFQKLPIQDIISLDSDDECPDEKSDENADDQSDEREIQNNASKSILRAGRGRESARGRRGRGGRSASRQSLPGREPPRSRENRPVRETSPFARENPRAPKACVNDRVVLDNRRNSSGNRLQRGGRSLRPQETLSARKEFEG